MKVFMLGWEFPPILSGGLGVACYGLAKALNSRGIDVLFVLPRPRIERKSSSHHHLSIARPAGAVPGADQFKSVPAASTQEVHHAVEQAAAHAAARQANEHGQQPPAPPSWDRGPSWEGAAAPVHDRALESVEEGHEVAEEVQSTETVHLQRVTFVPVDVWLSPYMTPQQYQRMVVEEQTGQRPLSQWGGPGGGTGGGRWVERAVAAPQGPVHQPPNTPTPQIHEPLPAHAIPAPPPMAPFHPPAPKRSYIEEPATQGASPVIGPPHSQYAGDLFTETERYARLGLAVARNESFDVVHAHDWMTFEAAMAVATAKNRPLIVQIHSTELDRAGSAANSRIMEIERQGMVAADLVIAVSYKTKTQLIEKYGIDPRKIEVVYNATDDAAAGGGAGGAQAALSNDGNGKPARKSVLFLGRLTQQKGPGYFLQAAKKVLSVDPAVQFIVAGKGEMRGELERMAEELGIARHVVFAGFLSRTRAQTVLHAADVYVMPSLSEPFGIAPLEALAQDVPVIISKQSGVAEVLRHVLKVDFWDTDDLANKILAVLRHPSLAATLREHGHKEVRQLSWEDSARLIVGHYRRLVQSRPAEAAEPAAEGTAILPAGGDMPEALPERAAAPAAGKAKRGGRKEK